MATAVNRSISSGRPWYKEPWPWALFGLPAAAVVAGVITLFYALNSDDGLVADDYYKQGLAINQTLARDKLALAKGYDASLALKDGQVHLVLRATNPGDLPASLRLHWAHPVRAGQDQVQVLSRNGSEYSAEAPALPPGRWLLEIEDLPATWRLVGPVMLPFAGQRDFHPGVGDTRDAADQ